ncbi:hypothetical protein DFH28DRAFT_923385 [Melampsora americana]|nr:hypothetical protein DFH28DRAFT_923385 [Melampsora americana]
MAQQASKSTALKMATATEWKSIAFIASIPKVVPSACKLLNDDSSNYEEWEFRIVSLIESITGLVGYFDQDDGIKTDPHGDRIIRNMLKHSISTRIARQISRCNSARSALMAIKADVIIPRPSTHLALWRDLLQNKLKDNSDINNYLHNVDTKIRALDRSSFPWTKDSMKGMLYQLGLGPLTGDRLAQWTHSQSRPPLDLVDIDGHSFTAEAAILGEVDRPDRTITTESWDQFDSCLYVTCE